MEAFFPSMMDSAVIKEYYDKLKLRSIYLLRQITEGIDLTKEIERIEIFLTNEFKPDVFHGKDSKELKYQKEFEEMCFILNQNMNKEAKKMSTLEFYTAFEMLKKIGKKNTSKTR